MHRMSLIGRGWTVLGLLWPLMGLGAEPTRLSVAVTAREADLAAQALTTGYALEQLLQEDPRFTLVPLGPGSAPDTERRERVAWARERTNEARSAYEELELELAVTRLDEALAALEEGSLEEGREELLAALALRALVHQGQGAPGKAERWLRRLFVIEPRYEFPAEVMSHQFFELVARVRTRADATHRVDWSIRTAGVAGLVFVDGRWRGVSPLDLTAETQGEHFLTVRAPGFEPYFARVQVEAAQVTEVTLVPLAQWKALRARLEFPEAEGAALARSSGAERVLLARLSPGESGWEVEAWVMDAEGQVNSERKRLAREEGAKEAADFIAAVLDREARLREVPPPPPPVKTWETRRVLLYSAVGVSALAGVTGALLGSSTVNQLSRSGSVPLLEEQRYQEAQAAARRTAIGANALYAVSFAAAGTAAWLLFMPEQRGPWSVQVSTVPGGMGATVRRSFE